MICSKKGCKAERDDSVFCKDHEIEHLRARIAATDEHYKSALKSLGNACWKEYYHGVQDGRDGTVYDEGFGEKFYGLKRSCQV